MNKFIDVEAVVEKKSKITHSILKHTNLLSYLKKIIHQEELNDFFTTNEHLKGLDFIDASLQRLQIQPIIKGTHNLPDKEANTIFVANHPLGGPESLGFIKAVSENYAKNLKFLVNDSLLGVKALHEYFVPVNNLGGKAISSQTFMTLDEAFEQQNPLLIYPAGLVSKFKKGDTVYDAPWKKTFISKSIEHNIDYITPVHISGKLSNFFYSLAWISRNVLRQQKIGLETAYLVDEMMKYQQKNYTLTFGKPIPMDGFAKEKNKENDTYNAQLIRSHVYRLEYDENTYFDLDSLKK